MATHKIQYGSVTALTCTLASLATGALTAGREAVFIDNTANLFDDIILSGKITVGTTPTVNTQIVVYVFAEVDNTPTWPDVFLGTDTAKTLTTVGVGASFLRVAAVLNVDSSTSNRTYPFTGISLASIFGGTLPPRIGVFVTHNTGVALNATAGNHALNVRGINYTIV